MKTSLDALQILYITTKNALFYNTSKPNGDIYKQQRPLNSRKEDVVVNGLPLNRDDIQRGVLNVNIYVPNLRLTVNKVTDNSQPNLIRLKELADIFNGYFLNEVWDEHGDYCFKIQQDNIFEDEYNQHYVNFRVEFYSANINN
ncbi:hypothetical protein [Desertivirga xinjiangensis]|uniref:hypothetical protein n=1 Tax=Desertivirga xinjiangensis TaxID=539206 RepID=UPI00210BF917|nr:hypothetical protein [Pedobacter xinjiangensis]